MSKSKQIETPVVHEDDAEFPAEVYSNIDREDDPYPLFHLDVDEIRTGARVGVYKLIAIKTLVRKTTVALK